MPDEPATAPDERGATPDERASASDERSDPAADGAAVDDPAAPADADLARVAELATVRHAPRFGAFIGTGVLVGVLLGLVLATALDTGLLLDTGGVLPILAGANGARVISALALGALGALVGALLALWADARSRRRDG